MKMLEKNCSATESEGPCLKRPKEPEAPDPETTPAYHEARIASLDDDLADATPWARERLQRMRDESV